MYDRPFFRVHHVISLSAQQKPLVQQWLRNYRKLKATLERICEVNHKLLRPQDHR